MLLRLQQIGGRRRVTIAMIIAVLIPSAGAAATFGQRSTVWIGEVTTIFASASKDKPDDAPASTDPDGQPQEDGLAAGTLNEARDLNNRALQSQTEGRTAEAEALYRKSLAVLEKSFGRDHPAFAAGLANLAALYQAEGRFPDAEGLYARALPLLEKSLGPDHYVVAFNMNNLGMLYARENRNNDAEVMFKRSLTFLERTFGFENPTVAATRYNLALVYDRSNRFTEAESQYKNSLLVLEKWPTPDYAAVTKILTQLAALYRRQGHAGEANAAAARLSAIQACRQGLATQSDTMNTDCRNPLTW